MRLTMAVKFSAEEVIGLLEEEMEDIEDEIEEPMCEGSDDFLGMFQETEDDKCGWRQLPRKRAFYLQLQAVFYLRGLTVNFG